MSIAFDTGPGNMVIDAVSAASVRPPFDRNGRLAARGEPIERVLEQLLRIRSSGRNRRRPRAASNLAASLCANFFALPPGRRNDVVATATALTARSIGIAVRNSCCPCQPRQWAADAAVSRVRRLRRWHEERHADAHDCARSLSGLKMRVRTSDEFGLPSRGERSGGLRAARLSNLAPVAVERSFRHRVQSGRRSWAKSAMREEPEEKSHFFRTRATPWRTHSLVLSCVGLALILLPGCARKPDPNTLVMIIESSPTNLDPRVGVDAQSERIDELLFDSLVRRDEHFDLQTVAGGELGDSRSANLHLSFASRRPTSITASRSPRAM